MNIAALALVGILTFLASMHIYWVLGGQWGLAAVIPTSAESATSQDDAKLFEPPRLATLTVAAALFVAATLVLWHVGILAVPLPEWISSAGVWALAVVFTLRAIGEFRYVGFFKRVRTTDFARMDTLLYSPLCLVIALLALVVVW